MRATKLRSPHSLVLAVTLASGAIAAGCAPETSTTHVTSADLSERPQLASVLVIGLAPGVVDRRELEDKLCDELSKRGVMARPSYAIFPDGVPEPDAARNAAGQAGIDGILTSRVRLVEQRKRYIPATEKYFWGFENGSYSRTSPGYYRNEEVAEFETTLSDTKDGKKLWSATTQTVNPKEGTGFAGSLAKEIVPKMQSAGFVPPER